MKIEGRLTTNLKVDICDRVQDYDAAFAAYESSNQAVKAGLEYQKFR